jgi:hypothetical protein
VKLSFKSCTRKFRENSKAGLPFHGAGGAHPVLLPRASNEGEIMEEKDLWRRLGFEGMREQHRGEGGGKRERRSKGSNHPCPLSPHGKEADPEGPARPGREAAMCMPYGGASPSATHAWHGKGEDEMACEMTILPLSTSRTTSMPPRLSPRSSTLHHRGNMERSLPMGPRTMQAHISVRLASLTCVEEKNRRRTNGQDEADHLNPMVRTTCCFRWPQSLGCLAAIF